MKASDAKPQKKKSATATNAPDLPTAIPTPVPAGKPVERSLLKSVASKIADKIGSVLKSGNLSSSPVQEKPAADGGAKSAAGPLPKARAKPGRKPALQAAADSALQSAGMTAIAATKMASMATQAGARKGADAVVEIAEKIEKSVVSKVSEVITKTNKSTSPAIHPEGSPITEEQLLKMSEKDYMNAGQLAFFRHRLRQLEKDLLKNAGETTEHLRETVLVPDPADRATIEEEHALELRTRDRERKLLKKVQQSIASIDSGEYGWCEETGEPIGVPRLLARPTATLSLEAQQRRELKQKLYGD